MASLPRAARDALALVAAFAVLLGGLFAYTGTWPPAVIVESGSMMHPDSEVTYGRVGTIDPGDLVLVKKVRSVDDVRTLVEGGKERYGKAGDVLVFHPHDDHRRTPIIHRAVAYVEVRGTGDATEYWVRWSPDAPCEGGARKRDAWCVYGREGVLVPSVPIAERDPTTGSLLPYRPEHSGFLTKGDNPVTNHGVDPVLRIAPPVKPEWIEGVGRGELPWLGLLKLSLAGKPNDPSAPPQWVKVGWASAPKDLWVMLGVTLVVLVGVPLAWDGVKAWQARRVRGA